MDTQTRRHDMPPMPPSTPVTAPVEAKTKEVIIGSWIGNNLIYFTGFIIVVLIIIIGYLYTQLTEKGQPATQRVDNSQPKTHRAVQSTTTTEELARIAALAGPAPTPDPPAPPPVRVTPPETKAAHVAIDVKDTTAELVRQERRSEAIRAFRPLERLVEGHVIGRYTTVESVEAEGYDIVSVIAAIRKDNGTDVYMGSTWR